MNSMTNHDPIISMLLKGDPLAAAKLISIVENEKSGCIEIMKKIYKIDANCTVIGITGPGGAGKSTLISNLINHYRSENKKIGVILIDPSSPLTGGAFLGDRIRMKEHCNDTEVFIRSIANRGNPGAISISTQNIVNILKAMGAEIIIVETVGAGQSEVEINFIADITLLLLTPGMGDEIQSLKAGILEVADIIILNKSDLEGSDKCFLDLVNAVSFKNNDVKKWKTKIISLVSIGKTENIKKGIEELTKIIEEHERYLELYLKKEVEEKKIKHQIEIILNYMIKEKVKKNYLSRKKIDNYLISILKGKENPYTIIEKIIEKI